VIELDIDLPLGALLDGYAADVSTLVAACGGTWLHGDERSLQLAADGETLIGWRSEDGLREAVPTKPNQGAGKRAVTETGQGLCCRAGEHCGFYLPDLDAETAVFSMAVLFHAGPEAEPRTLLTLNGDGEVRGASYLFLSDNGDSLVAKDTGECLSLDVPRLATPAPGLRCLIVTVCHDQIALQDNFGTIHQASGAPPALPSPASLFIGARSHRSGLLKTLGSSVIEDVLFLPEVSLLLPRTARDRECQAKLERYFSWRR